MKENSETEYTFSTKIPELLEGEGILEAPPRQLLIKYSPRGSYLLYLDEKIFDRLAPVH